MKANNCPLLQNITNMQNVKLEVDSKKNHRQSRVMPLLNASRDRVKNFLYCVWSVRLNKDLSNLTSLLMCTFITLSSI